MAFGLESPDIENADPFTESSRSAVEYIPGVVGVIVQ
jgi:hypothetical protein